MMLSRSNKTENDTHLKLKQIMFDRLREFSCVVDVQAEYLIKKVGMGWIRVDVAAIKKDMSKIYVEVKSNNNFYGAYCQVIRELKHDTNKNSIGIIVVKGFTKKRLMLMKRGGFTNKDFERIKVITYDEDFNLSFLKLDIDNSILEFERIKA